MMRRCRLLALTAIPRSAWDPKHHESKWYDSYAKHVAQRRKWPLKKYSIGLEPETPEDWLKYSLRNLAYAYNGALRACNTFPQMVPLYLEMKERGVKMDVDTMYVMLSRAARYEEITPSEIFQLFDEMCLLGAKADIAVVEVLHTLWEHSLKENAEWREATRLRLIYLYNTLIEEEVPTYAEKGHHALAAKQFMRYRKNIKSLTGRVKPENWARYLSRIESAPELLEAVVQSLWDYAPNPEHECTALNVHGAFELSPIPHLDSVLVRPVVDSAKLVSTKSLSEHSEMVGFAQDNEVNTIFLAALTRVIDYPWLSFPERFTAKGVLVVLENIFVKSKVYLSVDIAAQLMDALKFSSVKRTKYDRGVQREVVDADLVTRKDRDARTTFLAACRGPRGGDSRLWVLWNEHSGSTVDGRVVGRYLAARDPWGSYNYSPFAFNEKTGESKPRPYNQFTQVEAASSPSEESSTDSVAEGEEKTEASAPEGGAESSATPAPSKMQAFSCTKEDVDRRLADVAALITATKVLDDDHRYEISSDGDYCAPEVFTGQAIFLSRMFEGQSRNFAVASAIFQHLQKLKRDLDLLCDHDAAKSAGIAGAPPVPELECWVVILDTLKGIIDYVTTHHRSATETGTEDAHKLFQELMGFRAAMLEESKTRFNGRFNLVWLEEI